MSAINVSEKNYPNEQDHHILSSTNQTKIVNQLHVTIINYHNKNILGSIN